MSPFGRDPSHATASWLFRGLLGGLAGSTASSAWSAIAMEIEPSGAQPTELGARAVEHLLHRRIEGRDRKVVGELTHWSYGIAWGALGIALRRLTRRVGLGGPGWPLAAHVALLLSSELVALPALGILPPLHRWGRIQLATFALNDALYALGAELAYEALERRG